MAKVAALNTDAVVWGGMCGVLACEYNVSIISEASSSAVLGLHPGFSVHPVFWCANPNSLTPHSTGFYSTATSAALADSLLQVSTVNMANSPAAVNYGVNVRPANLLHIWTLNLAYILE